MQRFAPAHDGYLSPLRPFILIDTKIVGGPGKGLFQFLRSGRELYPHGFEPTLAHFVYDDDEPTEFEARAFEEKVPLIDLPARAPLDREALALARATIRARGCTVIQTHGYKSHLYGAFLRTMTGLPWIAFAHGWTTENAKVRLYHSLDRLLLPQADRVVAVSQKLHTTIARWRGANEGTSIIENAVDLPSEEAPRESPVIRDSLGIPATAPLIGSFGRLSREKGHRYLLEAFLSLEAMFPELHLLIVGSGPERPILDELRRTANNPSRIHLLPHTADIAPYFRAIDIFALPSLSEGLPNVVLEAMSFERPVVASSVGALPSTIANQVTGLLVPPADSAALEEALRALLSDEGKRHALARAGKESLHPRFSPTERARKIVALYRSTVGGGAPRHMTTPSRGGEHLCFKNHV